MLYHLALLLQPYCSYLSMLEHVGMRAMLGLMGAFTLMLLAGKPFIAFAERHFRSKVREYTPKQHQVKNNTPTMGGVLIGLVVLTSMMLWQNLNSSTIWLLMGALVGYAALGFTDDWLKITQKRGLSARQKFIGQWGLAFILMIAWYVWLQPDSHLYIPVLKWAMPFGAFIIPWGAFIVVGTSNAVNLTDGLDGLVTGTLLSSFITYGIITCVTGNVMLALYTNAPYVGASELVITSAIIVGALLGFLWYNAHPAKLFMGDVGSLMLGAALALIALLTRQELLLPITGGIFMIETVSVMLQVFSYKKLQRRIFKMAPLHHHFELSGIPETVITVRFWIVGFLLSLVSLMLFIM